MITNNKGHIDRGEGDKNGRGRKYDWVILEGKKFARDVQIVVSAN